MISSIRNLILPINNDYTRLFHAPDQRRFVFGHCQPNAMDREPSDQFRMLSIKLNERKITNLSFEDFKHFDHSFKQYVDESRSVCESYRVQNIRRRWGQWLVGIVIQLDQYLSPYDSMPMQQASQENTLEKCDELLSLVEHPPEYHQYTNGTRLFVLKACSILLTEMNLKEIKRAIDDIESGKHSVSNRLLSLLKGIYNAQQESLKVQEMLDSSELCKGFQVGQLYRLFIDERHWEKYGLKIFCYEDESGYAAAMLKAFRSTGDILASGKLEIDKIKQIHRLATSDVLSRKGECFIYDEFKYEDETLCRLGRTHSFANFSKKGFDEVKEVARQNGYPKVENDAYSEKIVHDHKSNRGFQLSNEFCQTFEAELQQIKESSSEGMEQESQKIACIAKVCRNLQFTHPFKDGNARTIGCILVNGLLMREGLSPSLIDNANKFDAYSVDELVEVIRSGQSQFNALKNRF